MRITGADLKISGQSPPALAALLILSAVLASSCQQSNESVSLEIVPSYEEGYDEELGQNASIFSLALVGGYSTDVLSVNVNLPYVSVSEIDDPPRPNESGPGDITLDVDAYLFGDYADGAYGGLVGGLKFDNGDEKDGLGTGGTDVTIGLLGGYAAPPVTLFGRLTHTFVGEPGGRNYQDVWSVQAGVSGRWQEENSAGVFIEGRESIDPDDGSIVTLYGYYRRELPRRMHLTVMPYAGLSDTAPDCGIVVGWGIEFDLSTPVDR